MGGSVSSEKGGFRLVNISEGGPAHDAGLQVFFDYVVAVSGVLVKQKDPPKWADGEEVVVTVYNLRSGVIRDVNIRPKQNWGGPGLLGMIYRYAAIEEHGNDALRVLNILPNSPASSAGLEAFEDYLLCTPEQIFGDISMLSDLVEERLDRGASLDMWVYNARSDSTRLLSLTPRRDWGGPGIVGCDFGAGLLHRLPPVMGQVLLRCGQDPKTELPSENISQQASGYVAQTADGGDNCMEVSIDRSSGQSLGMSLKPLTNAALQIEAISTGLVSEYNKSNSDTPVRVGYHIRAVNGVQGDHTAVLQELQRQKVLQLRIECREAAPAQAAPAQTPTAPIAPAQVQAQVQAKTDIEANELMATLDRSGGASLGLSLKPTSDGAALQIEAVADGIVSTWNAAHSHQQVGFGDRIVEVNGVQSKAQAIIDEIKRADVLRIRFQLDGPPLQRTTLEVSVDQGTGSSLGLSLDHDQKTSTLRITAIKDGLIAKWNASQPSLSHVLPGDVILEVNGVTGSGPKLVEELKQKKELTLKFERLIRPAASSETGPSETMAEKTSETEPSTNTLGERQNAVTDTSNT